MPWLRLLQSADHHAVTHLLHQVHSSYPLVAQQLPRSSLFLLQGLRRPLLPSYLPSTFLLGDGWFLRSFQLPSHSPLRAAPNLLRSCHLHPRFHRVPGI